MARARPRSNRQDAKSAKSAKAASGISECLAVISLSFTARFLWVRGLLVPRDVSRLSRPFRSGHAEIDIAFVAGHRQEQTPKNLVAALASSLGALGDQNPRVRVSGTVWVRARWLVRGGRLWFFRSRARVTGDGCPAQNSERRPGFCCPGRRSALYLYLESFSALCRYPFGCSLPVGLAPSSAADRRTLAGRRAFQGLPCDAPDRRAGAARPLWDRTPSCPS